MAASSSALKPPSNEPASVSKKPQPKRASSAASSPFASRESSPVRPPQQKANSTSRLSGPGRARLNNAQETSPSRTANPNHNNPSTPAAAASQKTLAATPTPILSPVPSNPTLRSPIPQKPTSTAEARETPRWPVSPRLRSPPPINRPSAPVARKSEPEIPSINVQQGTPTIDQPEMKLPSGVEMEENVTVMRTAPRGIAGGSTTLETVQEVSQPNTPGRGIDSVLRTEPANASKNSDENENPIEKTTWTRSVRRRGSLTTNESGSDSGGGKGEIKLRSTAATPSSVLRTGAHPPKPYGTTSAGRAKAPGEGSSTMTVETETVSSIPQVAVGVGAGGAGANGSLRAKPSAETIRPKKEKKRTSRKPPSATSGTGESFTSSLGPGSQNCLNSV